MLADQVLGGSFRNQYLGFQLIGLGLARRELFHSADQLLVECQREIQCLERSKCISSSFAVHHPAIATQGIREDDARGRPILRQPLSLRRADDLATAL